MVVRGILLNILQLENPQQQVIIQESDTYF